MKAPRRPARSPFTASLFEQLESRQMLAATLTGGVLTVDGSAKGDNIRVQIAGPNIVVHVNKSTRNFVRADVDSILVNGRAGNDKINVVNKQLGNVVIQGGSGNDNILGGGAGDLITGGAGNDTMRGRGGNDQIYGDAGDDKVFGDVGNDTLGGDDEDMLSDADINSTLEGSDTLNGGSGDDWLLSGTESDLHNDLSGADQLTGGDGDDITDIRGRDNTANHFEIGTGDGDTITDEGTDDDIIPIKDVTGPIDENDPDPYGTHLHAFLKIFINGVLQEIPDRVGEFNGEPVFHTHDEPTPPDVRGTEIHMHNKKSEGQRDFTLEEFFRNWGISFSSQNIGRFRVDADHKLTMTVRPKGGALINNFDFENYVIQTEHGDFDSTHFDQIVITYGPA
ncbi:MAG TPA: calcium-binding protein [Tepidisphaeraceae bacterium]|jgi:hypothetical protein|nr:calcium-binding protein [Tepidisphaeraceae bacterium]